MVNVAKFVIWLLLFAFAPIRTLGAKTTVIKIGSLRACNETCERTIPQEGAVTVGGLTRFRYQHHYAVVDVFFNYAASDLSTISPRDQNVFLMMPWFLKRLTRRTLRTNVTDTRIHIVSDNKELLAQAQSLGFYAHDVETYRHTEQDELLFSRIHRFIPKDATNSSEIENSIYRWIIFGRIVDKWNAERNTTKHFRSMSDDDFPIFHVLTLDGDVLLTMNAAKFYHSTIQLFTGPYKTEDDQFFELIPLALGVCNVFSRTGLSAFSQYLSNWFLQSKTEFDQHVAKLQRFQISDKLLFKEFIEANLKTRSNCAISNNGFSSLLDIPHEEDDDGLDVIETFNRQCLSHSLQCSLYSSLENFLLMNEADKNDVTRHEGVFLRVKKGLLRNDHWVSSLNEIWAINHHHNKSEKVVDRNRKIHRQHSPYQVVVGLQSSDEEYPLCFLHFDSPSTKVMMPIYVHAMSNLLDLQQYGHVTGANAAAYLSHEVLTNSPFHQNVFVTVKVNETNSLWYSLNAADNKKYHIRKPSSDIVSKALPVPNWLLHAFPSSTIRNYYDHTFN